MKCIVRARGGSKVLCTTFFSVNTTACSPFVKSVTKLVCIYVARFRVEVVVLLIIVSYYM